MRDSRQSGRQQERVGARQLTGRVSNRSGIGSKVEVRAGSLWQRLETDEHVARARAGGHRFRPRHARAGRRGARVVAGGHRAGGAARRGQDRCVEGASLAFTELDRKPSSCPYLYTWNGETFEFVTDFMGGGEMGYLDAPGVRNMPDPDRIRAHSRRSAEGAQRPLRTARDQRTRRSAVRRSLATGRGRASAGRGSLSERRPARAAVSRSRTDASPATCSPPPPLFDDAGHDVLARIARSIASSSTICRSRQIRGYARPHTLTIELGGFEGCGATDLLLLTGWTDYAFSSDNVAAHQAGLAMLPPSLQVQRQRRPVADRDREHRHSRRPAADVVVDLADKWLSASREVRIVDEHAHLLGSDPSRRHDRSSTLRRARRRIVARRSIRSAPICAGADSRRKRRRRPRAVQLRLRARLLRSPWKVMPGRYTREGDVRELLRAHRRHVRHSRRATRSRCRSTRGSCRRCRPAGRARSCSTPTASARRWTSTPPVPIRLWPLAVPRDDDVSVRRARALSR